MTTLQLALLHALKDSQRQLLNGLSCRYAVVIQKRYTGNYMRYGVYNNYEDAEAASIEVQSINTIDHVSIEFVSKET